MWQDTWQSSSLRFMLSYIAGFACIRCLLANDGFTDLVNTNPFRVVAMGLARALTNSTTGAIGALFF
jgi:hypothetical protein